MREECDGSTSPFQGERGSSTLTLPLRVETISSSTAKAYIAPVHYSKRVSNIQYAWGLMEGGALVGAVTFGKPSSPQVARSVVTEELMASVVELNRLVVTTATRNAASFLVGFALRRLPAPYAVVSFADSSQGHHGYIYQALGFSYCGLVAPHDAEYIVDGKRTHPRTLASRGITNPVAWAKANGIERVPIEPKHRYLKLKGIEPWQVKWKMGQAYPKGDNRRYDAPNQDRVVAA
jgi:hypothetical protein